MVSSAGHGNMPAYLLFHRELLFLKDVLVANGYPTSFIDK